MILKLKKRIFDFLDAPPYIPLRSRRYFKATSTIYFFGSLIHLGFLILFFLKDAREMMYFNIGSVFWFLFVIWVNRKGYLLMAAYLAFAEVFLHAAVCTHYFGWGSGFPYYPLLISTAIFILPPGRNVVQFFSTVFGGLFFSRLYYYTQFNEPIYTWESSFIFQYSIPS